MFETFLKLLSLYGYNEPLIKITMTRHKIKYDENGNVILVEGENKKKEYIYDNNGRLSKYIITLKKDSSTYTELIWHNNDNSKIIDSYMKIGNNTEKYTDLYRYNYNGYEKVWFEKINGEWKEFVYFKTSIDSNNIEHTKTFDYYTHKLVKNTISYESEDCDISFYIRLNNQNKVMDYFYYDYDKLIGYRNFYCKYDDRTWN